MGLRVKLYSYKIIENEKCQNKKCEKCEDKKCEKCEDEKCEKSEDDKKPMLRKCKGIKKSVIKKSIAHEDYKRCLSTGKKQLQKMNVIRSHKHEVYTEEVYKIALCPDDDKRHILEDGVHTLALGHYRI